MSETGIDGNVDGPVQSGTFSAPVQTVTIVVPPNAPIEPPDSVRDSIKDIWKIVVGDQLDRRERQRETDEHRVALTNRIDRIDMAVQNLSQHIGIVRWMSGIGVVGALAWIYQLGMRAGWW